MFDTTFFLVMSVIFSGSISNMFLNYLDENYGVSTFVWYLISYLFFMVPVSLNKYTSTSSKCKKRSFIDNIIQALKSTAVTIGSVDILSFLLGFLPVYSLIELIPIIGSSLAWLSSYFIYKFIESLLKLFSKNNSCNKTGLTKSLFFGMISIFKAFIYDLLPI